MFPICSAGCVTDDSTRRDFFKTRLQRLDDSIGNSMQTRLVMETLWQKRDISGVSIDFRDTIRDQGLNLLLI